MDEYENLKLDHQLCFALYAASHAITKAYRSVLENYELTYPQYLVMLVLWESDGINVNAIAQRLDLNSSTLTPMLKRLEAAGFITRVRSKQDERLLEIKLTNIGFDLKHEISKAQKNVECQTGLCEEEFIELRSSLYSLVEKMAKNAKNKEAA